MGGLYPLNDGCWRGETITEGGDSDVYPEQFLHVCTKQRNCYGGKFLILQVIAPALRQPGCHGDVHVPRDFDDMMVGGGALMVYDAMMLFSPGRRVCSFTPTM